MAMKLRADTLRSELAQIISILLEWQKKLEDEGVPGDETPANDLNVEIFEMQFRGELLLAANRLTSITEVLSE